MEARGDRHVPPWMARKRARDSSSSGVEDDDDEGESSGSDGISNARLNTFDLDCRMEYLKNNYEWAQRSKARAEQIRFGVSQWIVWWKGRPPRPENLLPLDPDTGTHRFDVDAQVCENLRFYLDDPKNYTEEGWLLMADTTWPGYSGYPWVHAPDGHVSLLQERLTVRVQGMDHVNLLLRKQPQVSALVQEVRRVLGVPQPTKSAPQPTGKKIQGMHFLLQDKSQQAEFTWHDDSADIGRAGGPNMTTVIVNLSQECSGMRIWGCRPVIYERQGHSVAFPGAALHETLPRSSACPARSVVRKVALFFN